MGRRAKNINLLVVFLTILARITVPGWSLVTLGIIFLLPITIFHFVAINRTIDTYRNNYIYSFGQIYVSIFMYPFFMLLQSEGDDMSSFIVVDGLISRFNSDYNMRTVNIWSNIKVFCSIISGITMIICDLTLFLKVNKYRKGIQ
ncbi:MAG: hypothetical protein ACKVOU_04825 [Cytophagales bacterium]